MTRLRGALGAVGAVLTYSDEERRATMVGVNLFFGALMGANLGVTERLPLGDYAQLVVLLCGMITGMFTIVVSQRRSVVIVTSGAIAVILGMIVLSAVDLVPPDAVADLHRIIVTLLIWLAFIVAVKLTPAAKDRSPTPAPQPPREMIAEE